ncbi:MAG: TonB-dependent receptor [Myxococcota bacterium]
MNEVMSTASKALDLNLDTSWYGSFAEIGAGQEVGRWFFRVGGAAGTIAKTMSAYDKKVSDSIYGTADRYVSSGRLQAMLDHEYDLLVERLDVDRGEQSSFFAFADTVAAQTYRGDADCQGWMGIRFQTRPRAASSQILLHARMLDRDALMQQEALGILGVNLIHGAARLAEHPERLLAALLDNLGPHRIEIDMVEFKGAAFRSVDHRVISLRLVECGLARAAMFSASGEVLRPSEVLYKRPVILQRGRFRPPTRVHTDIQHRALARFCEESDVDESRVLSLLEIGVKELRETQGDGLADFLDRIHALTAGNQSVLISDYPEYHLVAEYLRRYATTQIALPLGVTNFVQLMNEDRYTHLRGGILEVIGRLFATGVRIYVYPGLDPETGERIGLDTVRLSSGARKLVDYLKEKQYVCGIEGLPDVHLRVRSDDVLAWLRAGDPRWEDFVEPEVVRAIKRGRLFAYGGPPAFEERVASALD